MGRHNYAFREGIVFLLISRFFLPVGVTTFLKAGWGFTLILANTQFRLDMNFKVRIMREITHIIDILSVEELFPSQWN